MLMESEGLTGKLRCGDVREISLGRDPTTCYRDILESCLLT